MTLDFHPEAQEELTEAVLYLDRRNESLGDALRAAYRTGLDAIERHPLLYAVADDAPAGAEVREYYVARFKYRILYLVRPDRVTVLAFAHASRRPGYWSRRLP